MTSWLADYQAALTKRDAHEQANLALINAYTSLADRTASLLSPPAQTSSPTAQPPTTQPSPSDTLHQLRQDLTTAQRTKATLITSLETATSLTTSLQTRITTTNKRLNELVSERNNLATRIRDRDEELRGKAKLLENVQDEMVSLSLQLNMAEERSAKLALENAELVARWMKRMGREADEMNEASQFS